MMRWMETYWILTYFCITLGLVCWHPFYAKRYRSQKKKNAWQTISYTILNQKNRVSLYYSHSRKIHRKVRKFLWEFVSLFSAKVRLDFYIFNINYQKSIIKITHVIKNMEIQSLTVPEIIVLWTGASLVIWLTGQAVVELVIQWTKKIYQSWALQRKLKEYLANYQKNNPLRIEQPTGSHVVDYSKPWYKQN